MQMVQAFQEFNGPYVITNGGPLKSTYLLPLYIYEMAFKKFNMGYASAIAWVFLGIIMVLTLIAFWSSKHWVYYAGDKRSGAMSDASLSHTAAVADAERLLA